MTLKNIQILAVLLLIGFVAVDASGQGASFVNPETGQLHKFVAGNYTDLGVDNNGNMSNTESTVRSHAGSALDKLKNVGVTNVRVWPFRHNENDYNKMANRVSWLASEAAQRDMTLVVDLFDSSSQNSYGHITENEARIDNMINVVIAQNANKSNIYWSLGNEIGGYENPLAFATFYENKVAAMRSAGALHISFHPVPGSLNHDWTGVSKVAAERCIAASDDVSPHFYAKGAVSNEGSVNGLELGSLQQLIEIGHNLCKPVIIGEFGIKADCDPPHTCNNGCTENYSQRTAANISGWLNYFENTLKVDQVSFWQFKKETLGHLDAESYTPIFNSGGCIGNGTHEDAMSGYLNSTPNHPSETCTGGGDPPTSNPTNVALNKSIYGQTSQYSSAFSAAKAIDGQLNTKWTTGGTRTSEYMIVDLGQQYNISQFKLQQASAGGEAHYYNMESCWFGYWANSKWNWTGQNYPNQYSNTFTKNVSVTARYVVLWTNNPNFITFADDKYVRLPEFEVYGTSVNGNRLASVELEPDVMPNLNFSVLRPTVFPNPASKSNVVINFDVKEECEGTLFIYSDKGQIVKEIPTGLLETGTQRMKVDLSGLNTGTYFYKITLPGVRTEAQKLILMN